MIMDIDSPEQLAAGRYIYDSGKVLSGESVGVVYQGKALQPSTRYYWKVSVWDESGTEITSTEPAWFETGLLGSGWSDARFILRHTTDGKTRQDAAESLASIIPASDKHKVHHIWLKVTTAHNMP